MDDRIIRGCYDKKCYGSEAIAERKASDASLQTGQVILPYHCMWCGQWHIGHASPKRLKALGYEVAEEFGKPERMR